MTHAKITKQLKDDLDKIEELSPPLYHYEEGTGLRPYAQKVHAERLSLESHIRRDTGTRASKSMERNR